MCYTWQMYYKCGCGPLVEGTVTDTCPHKIEIEALLAANTLNPDMEKLTELYRLCDENGDGEAIHVVPTDMICEACEGTEERRREEWNLGELDAELRAAFAHLGREEEKEGENENEPEKGKGKEREQRQ